MEKIDDEFISANGIQVHYYRTGDKRKPSILLLHGISDNGQCWPAVSRDLSGSYDVIMTDARGHGQSSGIETGFSISILAEDAAAVIRELGLEKPFLFGHSMGAMTALALAAKYPELVRATILEDPPLMEPAPDESGNKQKDFLDDPRPFRQMLSALKALSGEERLAMARTLNPTLSDEENRPWADSKAEFKDEVLEQAIEVRTFPWKEALARIECPVFLLTGDVEKGAAVRPETAAKASQLLKNGEVKHIEGAGHSIHRDRYKETMKVVQAFLDSN